MRKLACVAAVVTGVLLSPLMTIAQSRCAPGEIVVVDRSTFSPTIERARRVVRDYGGGNGTGLAYVEGSDVTSFANQVAAFHPKMVVVHYSMFRPGALNRGMVTSLFLDQLKQGTPPPSHYVQYSSSFFDENLHKQGRTLESLRGDGFFAGLPDDSITLIYVDDGARFTAKNGAPILGEAIRDFVAEGNCNQ